MVFVGRQGGTSQQHPILHVVVINGWVFFDECSFSLQHRCALQAVAICRWFLTASEGSTLQQHPLLHVVAMNRWDFFDECRFLLKHRCSLRAVAICRWFLTASEGSTLQQHPLLHCVVINGWDFLTNVGCFCITNAHCEQLPFVDGL